MGNSGGAVEKNRGFSLDLGGPMQSPTQSNGARPPLVRELSWTIRKHNSNEDRDRSRYRTRTVHLPKEIRAAGYRTCSASQRLGQALERESSYCWKVMGQIRQSRRGGKTRRVGGKRQFRLATGVVSREVRAFSGSRLLKAVWPGQSLRFAILFDWSAKSKYSTDKPPSVTPAENNSQSVNLTASGRSRLRVLPSRTVPCRRQMYVSFMRNIIEHGYLSPVSAQYALLLQTGLTKR